MNQYREFFLRDRVSCSPSWPWSHLGSLGWLSTSDLFASTFKVLGMISYVITLSLWGAEDRPQSLMHAWQALYLFSLRTICFWVCAFLGTYLVKCQIGDVQRSLPFPLWVQNLSVASKRNWQGLEGLASQTHFQKKNCQGQSRWIWHEEKHMIWDFPCFNVFIFLRYVFKSLLFFKVLVMGLKKYKHYIYIQIYTLLGEGVNL